MIETDLIVHYDIVLSIKNIDYHAFIIVFSLYRMDQIVLLLLIDVWCQLYSMMLTLVIFNIAVLSINFVRDGCVNIFVPLYI